MADDWLDDIVLVNESPDEASAGDVSLFRSIGEACRHLEHWWVEGGRGFAYTAAGDRLTLGVDNRDRVIATGKEHVPGGAEVVLGWLRHSAAVMLDVRRAKAVKRKKILSPSEERGELPSSVEGLIAYIGFDE